MGTPSLGTNKPIRIAIVAHTAPEPAARAAGGVFVFEHVSSLTTFADVIVLTRSSEHNRHICESAQSHTPVALLTVTPGPIHRFPIVRKLWRRLFGFPPIFPTRRALIEDRSWRNALKQADLIEIQSSNTYDLGLLPTIRRLNKTAPVVVVCVDILADPDLHWLDPDARTFSRCSSRLSILTLRYRERYHLNRASMITVFHGHAERTLREMGVSSRIEIVPPTIPKASSNAGPSIERTVLFVGTMSRGLNVAAVEWFVRNVWHRIRTLVPDARFVVAGEGPPTSLRTLDEAGVHVMGSFDDLDAVYASARVVVAPLLRGSGIKFKVLEAMSRGIPVVATPIAAAGIDSSVGANNFAGITDSPKRFAEYTALMLIDHDAAKALGTQAQHAVEEHYSPHHVRERLESLYRGLLL